MLDEVIRELTAKSNDEQMTSEGVLAWAKRVEVQRAEAAILNNITESCQSDRIKMAQKPKSNQDRPDNKHNISQMNMQILEWDPQTLTVPSIWEDVHQIWEDRPLQEGVQEQEGLCNA